MMAEAKTHIRHDRPRMAARDLADYMAASEVSKRTVVRNSKYEPLLHVAHHDEPVRPHLAQPLSRQKTLAPQGTAPLTDHPGRVAERLKAPVLKTGDGVSRS